MKKKKKKAKGKVKKTHQIGKEFDPNVPYPLPDFLEDVRQMHTTVANGVLRFTQPFDLSSTDSSDERPGTANLNDSLFRLASHFNTKYDDWSIASSRFLRYRGVSHFLTTYRDLLLAEGSIVTVPGGIEVDHVLLESLLTAEAESETGEITIQDLDEYFENKARNRATSGPAPITRPTD
jgi:hypothetical protein